jgi:hypothetical protein
MIRMSEIKKKISIFKLFFPEKKKKRKNLRNLYIKLNKKKPIEEIKPYCEKNFHKKKRKKEEKEITLL